MVKKKVTQRKTTKQEKPIKTFDRWLIAGLTTIFMFIMGGLILALLTRGNTGISAEGSFLVGAFTFLTYAAAAWWLFESARWIVIAIERNNAPKKSIKKKK